MPGKIVLGAQWGDEGKGKYIDIFASQADMVVRSQGGNNAGHTVVVGDKKYKLQLIPSGILYPDCINIIGPGVVVNPKAILGEIDGLNERGISTDKLFIDARAHCILPWHLELDALSEKARGGDDIGTTKKGIGPTYTDKISRNGLRVGDIFDNFAAKYATAKQRHVNLLTALGEGCDVEELEKKWMDAIEYMKGYDIIDSEFVVNRLLNEGKSVLCEGAQGSLLDVDFGSYPFVTSSNTVCAGACSGLGVAPNKIGEVFGIFKAYCTRVGSGPFPTELFDETGAKIRAIGHEYGAVTGRERRCGWLDLVALRYTIMLNGVTQLIMMKSDVLDDFDTIKVCNEYRVNGEVTKDFPFSVEANVEPVYTEMEGWKTDMTGITSEAEFPAAFKNYIAYIERELGVPVTIVSVGPDRAQTIVR